MSNKNVTFKDLKQFKDMYDEKSLKLFEELDESEEATNFISLTFESNTLSGKFDVEGKEFDVVDEHDVNHHFEVLYIPSEYSNEIVEYPGDYQLNAIISNIKANKIKNCPIVVLRETFRIEDWSAGSRNPQIPEVGEFVIGYEAYLNSDDQSDLVLSSTTTISDIEDRIVSGEEDFHYYSVTYTTDYVYQLNNSDVECETSDNVLNLSFEFWAGQEEVGE